MALSATPAVNNTRKCLIGKNSSFTAGPRLARARLRLARLGPATTYAHIPTVHCFGARSYRLRQRTEECFRQLKNAWKICDFPSPCRSLLEAHVGFTLATYSLLQLYLLRADLQAKAARMISSLKREDPSPDQNLMVYADDAFGRFSLREFLSFTYDLPKETQNQLATALANAIHQR